jgi:hypothetical protein
MKSKKGISEIKEILKMNGIQLRSMSTKILSIWEIASSKDPKNEL